MSVEISSLALAATARVYRAYTISSGENTLAPRRQATPSPKELQAQLAKQRRKVDVEHLDISVRELVQMVLRGEIVRAPTYQRKFRWDEGRESRLIESLLLGLPVPSIFVATNEDVSWELVDGLQRLSTLLHFFASPSIVEGFRDADKSAKIKEVLNDIHRKSPLRLAQLELLSNFNGCTYDQLPSTIQIHLARRMLRITALSDKSDYDVRFQMFERLNTGGVTLTPQEVRACIFRGEFVDFLSDLATEDDFVSLVKLKRDNRDDGTMEELVLKVFAYLDNSSNYKGEVKNFLNDYAKEVVQNARPFSYARNRTLFRKSAEAVLRACKGEPFLRDNVNTTPLVQFEAAMVAAARLIREGRRIVAPRSDWRNEPDYVKSSTGATNSATKLRERILQAEYLLGEK